jgi:hypothetical protein
MYLETQGKGNMNLTKDVLPGSSEGISPEDLGKANEIQKRMELLESCFAFDSDAAKAAQFDSELFIGLTQKTRPSHVAEMARFYAKLAQLKGERFKESFEKGLKANQKVLDAFKSIDRTLERIGKVSQWSREKVKDFADDPKDDLKNEFMNRVGAVNLKLLQRLDNAYKQIADISESYWIYLSFDMQEILESMARHVLIKGIVKSFNACLEADWAISDFSKSIFSAVEAGKSQPKLRVLDLNISPETEKTIKIGRDTIQSLTQELVELPHIEEVRAVFDDPVSNDLHDARFYLRLSPEAALDSSSDAIESLWEIAEDLVFSSNVELRKLTGEKWYFHAQIVEDFSDYPNSNRIIAVSHG